MSDIDQFAEREQKIAMFDRLNRQVAGRSGEGKSQRFQAMIRWLDEVGPEIGKERTKVQTR